MQDEQLLEAWQGGNESAGRELFSRHFDAVFWFFRNKVDAGADDLAQETFVSLVRNKHNLQRVASFRSYLFAVARSRLIDALRSRAARGNFDTLQSSIAELGLSPSAVIDGRREQAHLLDALGRLPIELQVLLELRFFEQMSGPELAETLELPEGTVRTRLRRALALLRQHLAVSDGPRDASDGDLERWAQELRRAPR